VDDLNLLIVDDQITVTDSLKEGLSGRTAGIEEIFTANSAEVARLIMKSFPVDIILADIEMPEENGLSLLKWTLEEFPEMVGIFLTSHAEFAYAKEAIRLGCFDYIMQPARMEEIEAVLERAVREAQKKKRAARPAENRLRLHDQTETILELLLVKARENKTPECEKLYGKLRELFSADYDSCVFRTAQVRIVRMEKQNNAWDEELIKLVFHNVLEELLSESKSSVIAVREEMGSYCLTAASDGVRLNGEQWTAAIKSFCEFINSYMDFRIAVYTDPGVNRIYDSGIQSGASTQPPGVYLTGKTSPEDASAGDDMADRMEKAKDYIKTNVGHGITRTDVAKYLHMNEDYFTRCFKKHTGYTFKEYDILVRMETAKRLLEQTKLPVSMIAGKVGFDNFSHFSQAFRKYSGKTPSEYR